MDRRNFIKTAVVSAALPVGVVMPRIQHNVEMLVFVDMTGSMCGITCEEAIKLCDNISEEAESNFIPVTFYKYNSIVGVKKSIVTLGSFEPEGGYYGEWNSPKRAVLEVLEQTSSKSIIKIITDDEPQYIMRAQSNFTLTWYQLKYVRTGVDVITTRII